MIPSSPISCILVTRDTALAKRIEEELGADFAIQRADLTSMTPTPEEVVLLDLRTAGATAALRNLTHYDPPLTVIALGAPETEPWQAALNMNVYAQVDVRAPTLGLLELVSHAAERAHLIFEISRSRNTARVHSWPSLPQEHTNASSSADGLPRSSCMPAALRSFHDVPLVLQTLIEDVAQKMQVQRAGLFSLDASRGHRYVLRARLRCLRETEQLNYD